MGKKVRDFFLLAFGLWLLPGLALMGYFLLRSPAVALGGHELLRLGLPVLLMGVFNLLVVVLPRLALNRLGASGWAEALDRRFLLLDFSYLLLMVGLIRLVEGNSWPVLLLAFLYACGLYFLVQEALGKFPAWRRALWFAGSLLFNLFSIGALILAMALAVKLGDGL